MFGALDADIFLSYAIPAITVMLAILGIIFGKDGNVSTLTRTGVLILGLTVIAGLLGLLEVSRKDRENRVAKSETAQANSNIRRINNLLIAGTGGLLKKVSNMNLWLTVIDDGGSGETVPASEIAAPGDDGTRVPAALADQFNGLLVSKSDMGAVVDIKFTYLYDELAFHITPRTDTQFAVRQTVTGSVLDYICENDCPIKEAEAQSGKKDGRRGKKEARAKKKEAGADNNEASLAKRVVLQPTLRAMFEASASISTRTMCWRKSLQTWSA